MSMTHQEIRLECLKLAMPHGVSNFDVDMVKDRAEALFAFVMAGENLHTAPATPAESDTKARGPRKSPAAA